MTRARAAVLVLAGLTLAACGNVHPGAAAVVDDQTISMKSLDKTAKVYCLDKVRSATSKGEKFDNAEIRRQTVTSMVALLVARKVAEKEGVTPKRSTYELSSAEQRQWAKTFSTVDPKVVTQAIEDSRELSQITIAVGEKVTGQTVTADNQAQVGAAGQAEIAKAFKDNDVKFAPRFGLSSGAKAVANTGSLSVAKADAKPDQLPAAQRCS